MRVAVFSYMYPSPRHPTSGVWVEQQARALAREIPVEVVSPVPWAPRVLWPFAARWAAYGRQPRVERRHGLVVHHPRYAQPMGQWAIPLAGVSMARAAAPVLARIVRGGVDLIHAHQLLPDGLAAVLLGRRFGRPVVCTLHGSDVTAVPHHDRAAAAAARFVARRAHGFIAVVDALVDALAAVAPAHAPVAVVPNGIDVDLFRPLDRAAARRQLGLVPGGRVILYAGLLIERKGVDVLLDAFARLAVLDARLVVVGGSAERDDRRAALEARASALGCRARVSFVGPRPHEEMPVWFSAADVFALASRLEGFPTVVREAIACGTPCVVTDLPGVAAEIGPACGTECGVVVPPDDPRALAAALAAALARRWDRGALRRRAERWHWRHNAAATLRVYADAVGATGRAVA